MNKIGLLNTSIMTFNMGDYIIVDGVKSAFTPLFKDAYIVDVPTHTPVFHGYEFGIRKERNSFYRNLRNLDYKFLCGTNILSNNMFKRMNLWNVRLSDTKYLNNIILVGAGCGKLTGNVNFYTRRLYNRLLSHDYIHSVRDERSRVFLEKLGFKALNTGCTTLWGLNHDYCLCIPKIKSDSVIFTLTDYAKSPIIDKTFIDILFKNYGDIYFWIQGFGDLEYLKSLKMPNFNKIKLIGSSLEEYDAFLTKVNCDFVGTRLHAGIRAMQKKRRTIIIGVDNRASDMAQTYNINYVERNNVKMIDELINSQFVTDVKIKANNINKFMSQFIKE